MSLLEVTDPAVILRVNLPNLADICAAACIRQAGIDPWKQIYQEDATQIYSWLIHARDCTQRSRIFPGKYSGGHVSKYPNLRPGRETGPSYKTEGNDQPQNGLAQKNVKQSIGFF